jgi:hypothetical protein
LGGTNLELINVIDIKGPFRCDCIKYLDMGDYPGFLRWALSRKKGFQERTQKWEAWLSSTGGFILG